MFSKIGYCYCYENYIIIIMEVEDGMSMKAQRSEHCHQTSSSVFVGQQSLKEAQWAERSLQSSKAEFKSQPGQV